MNRIGLWLLSTTLVLGCSGEDPPGGAKDAGPTTDRDAGADCVPSACPADACGMVDDGCGGTLDCGTCGCTPGTFTVDCPERPCETLTGCEAGACTYEPVICDFELCACPDGTECGDEDPRPCGPGCPSLVCDPRPTGNGRYSNTCVPLADLRCGLCDLGGVTCDASDALVCDGPDLPWIDAEAAECNGGSPVSTVVYLDPFIDTMSPNGSREEPFTEVSDAIAAAVTRGSRLIVVGRSEELVGTQVVIDGVSMIGGYSGWPSWRPDPSHRPVFHATSADVTDGRLTGVHAANITLETRVEHVRVITDDVTAAGTTNAAVVATNASALELVDVDIIVGDAGDGAIGTDGTTPTAGGDAAGGGQMGYLGTNEGACNRVVRGGAAGTRTCDGTAIVNAAGGAGGGGSGSQAVPAGAIDECSTVDTIACYHVRGDPGASGAAGGLKRRPTWSGGPGQPGDVHPDLDPGADGMPIFELVDGFLVPTGAGAPGADGANGNGGGGGSSGQITRRPPSGPATGCDVGGAGGGGGAGGCGGGGGTGGGPGGWAVGLVVSDSDGIRLEAITATIGAGGLGGTGGIGAAGTSGSNGGGAGAPPGTPGRTSPAQWGGAVGGRGSDGQSGGDGGSGAAGRSVGVVCDARISLETVTSTSGADGFVAGLGCDQ